MKNKQVKIALKKFRNYFGYYVTEGAGITIYERTTLNIVLLPEPDKKEFTRHVVLLLFSCLFKDEIKNTKKNN